MAEPIQILAAIAALTIGVTEVGHALVEMSKRREGKEGAPWH